MRKKGGLSNFERGMVVGARWAGLMRQFCGRIYAWLMHSLNRLIQAYRRATLMMMMMHFIYNALYI